MTVGALLIDRKATKLEIVNPHFSQEKLTELADAILQAARIKFTKTEYISCPGCGRTLYDLRTTIARIKAATSQYVGLKIGIMGCIVNGPGEMADADYGYVGAGVGKISLYKGKECVERLLPRRVWLVCLWIDGPFLFLVVDNVHCCILYRSCKQKLLRVCRRQNSYRWFLVSL